MKFEIEFPCGTKLKWNSWLFGLFSSSGKFTTHSCPVHGRKCKPFPVWKEMK